MANDDRSFPEMDKEEFFAWCEANGLDRNQDISAAFRVSSQTIRNWRKKEPKSKMTAWVPFACAALEAATAGTIAPKSLERITVSRLSEWQVRHRFKTYDDTAAVFSVTRQAVHNWYKRQRFPKWLALACVGYDIRTRSEARKELAAVA